MSIRLIPLAKTVSDCFKSCLKALDIDAALGLSLVPNNLLDRVRVVPGLIFE